MDLTRPISTVVPSLDGPVLGVLAGTTQPLTGRRVHGLAGVGSETGVRKVLHRLVETGLVTAAEVGPSTVYALNRDHLAASAVLELTALRQLLIERFRGVFLSWSPQPLRHASLFGSAARGDGSVTSDIDLLLITDSETEQEEPSWVEQVGDLADRVHRWTGNHAQIYELSPSQFQQHLTAQEPIVQEWARDSITLFGPGIRQLRNQFTGTDSL